MNILAATAVGLLAGVGALLIVAGARGNQVLPRPKPPTSEALCEATRPYYEYTIEKFGVDRCMFESNFPVDKLSCSYNVLYNSFKRLTANYSAAEKAKLYHDVAAETYKLSG